MRRRKTLPSLACSRPAMPSLSSPAARAFWHVVRVVPGGDPVVDSRLLAPRAGCVAGPSHRQGYRPHATGWSGACRGECPRHPARMAPAGRLAGDDVRREAQPPSGSRLRYLTAFVVRSRSHGTRMISWPIGQAVHRPDDRVLGRGAVNAIDTMSAPLYGHVRHRLITPNHGGTLGVGKSQPGAGQMCWGRGSLARSSVPCGGFVRPRLTDRRFHALGRTS